MFKWNGDLQVMLFKLVVVVCLLIMVGIAAANEWRVISELPTQRAGFSTAVVDGKVYLIGGTRFEHEQGVLREPGPGIWRGPFGMSLMEVYDPETNTWQRLADMP
ncbi:MAG: kelch repeat-containing protein, partial [Candidatus Poribacteria bacterium]|nr:kelch repeat-containing protein [Candidatus Poribacteria bacterium]